MRIEIGGKRWKLKFCQLSKVAGECDRPDLVGKEIRISSKLKDKKKLDTLIHEILHALSWHQFDESWVSDSATDLAEILWKFYREREQDDCPTK